MKRKAFPISRSIRDLKRQLTLLGKVTLLERDSTLTIFTSKVIDVPSTFRNEDNEYVPRTPIDLVDIDAVDTVTYSRL